MKSIKLKEVVYYNIVDSTKSERVWASVWNKMSGYTNTFVIWSVYESMWDFRRTGDRSVVWSVQSSVHSHIESSLISRKKIVYTLTKKPLLTA